MEEAWIFFAIRELSALVRAFVRERYIITLILAAKIGLTLQIKSLVAFLRL